MNICWSLTLATMAKRHFAVFGLLILCVGSLCDTEDCWDKQSSLNHIELCHDNPRLTPDGPYSCGSSSTSDTDTDQPTDQPRDMGFVVKNLMIAPLSKFKECGDFRARDFLSATCLRKKVKDVDSFDGAVFDVLDKVSGKFELNSTTVVRRFDITEKSGSAAEGNSSFVSLRKLCKPARPAPSSSDNHVLNMCSKGRVTNAYVYLTLKGTVQVPDVPSLCRCTIRPSNAIKLEAIDIRLQLTEDRHCDPFMVLKIDSKNQTEKLRCQGLKAWYEFQELFSSDRDVVLDLIHISKKAFPTALWIQVKEVESEKFKPVIVSCEGIRPLTPEEKEEAEKEENEKEGENLPIIAIVVPVVVAVLVVAIVIFVMVKQRRCPAKFCKCLQDDDIYTEPSTGNVYSKPGKHRPSKSTPFTFPDENPDKAPPPPTTPPPTTPDPPPVASIPHYNPLPKAKRTYSHGESAAAEGNEDEYSHLNQHVDKAKEKARGENYDHALLMGQRTSNSDV